MDLILLPAYGRDYNSKDAVLADYNDGKDFIIATAMNPYYGKPISKRDITNETVKFRYNKKRNAFYLNDFT